MPTSTGWLTIIVRIAIAPVLVGALALILRSPSGAGDLAAATGLLILAAIHCAYWWNPWQRTQGQAVAAAIGMAAVNLVLLNIVGFSEPLVWLYPALVAGAGLRTPVAVLGIALMALAAAAPLAVDGGLVHPTEPLRPAGQLGPSHSVLLSIVLAGLGMHAVRQLIATNADLHATRAELAELAVAADRERLERELHDLLARTLSLIAVKAELASRLSKRGDDAAAAELADVQQLARQAVRDVRSAVTDSHSPNLEAELASAEVALRTAGIEVSIERNAGQVDPTQQDVLAWAVREAVTNVVKHSDAQTCRIALLKGTDGSVSLEVEDDGRGAAQGSAGVGLNGLADRVNALGGELQVGPRDEHGFRVQVRLGAPVPRRTNGALAA
jgi:two-component system sensor histidine kinase DesK